MYHVDALNKYTTKALNDSLHSISLLNTEVSQIRKAVLQNRMALDVLTAAQGGTCAIIKTECCVYIPDYHKNVSGLIKDMNAQIKALQDPSLSLGDWLASWFEGGLWPTFKNLLFGLLILTTLLILINLNMLLCSVLLYLMPRLHWCNDFTTTDDPYYTQRHFFPVSAGFSCLHLL